MPFIVMGERERKTLALNKALSIYQTEARSEGHQGSSVPGVGEHIRNLASLGTAYGAEAYLDHIVVMEKMDCRQIPGQIPFLESPGLETRGLLRLRLNQC